MVLKHKSLARVICKYERYIIYWNFMIWFLFFKKQNDYQKAHEPLSLVDNKIWVQKKKKSSIYFENKFFQVWKIVYFTFLAQFPYF